MDARMSTLQDKIRQMDRELFDLKKQMKRARGAGKARLMKRAKMVLQRRKMLDQQYGQTMNQSFAMEQTTFAIQSAKDTKEQVAAMKGARDELQKFSQDLNLDEVEDLYDDMDDILMDQEEVQEIMGRSFGNIEDVDEDELMAEIDGIGEEDFEEFEDDVPAYMPEASNAPLPASATSQPAVAQKDDYGLPIPVQR